MRKLSATTMSDRTVCRLPITFGTSTEPVKTEVVPAVGFWYSRSTPALEFESTRSPVADWMSDPSVTVYVPLTSCTGQLMRKVRAARLGCVPGGLAETVTGEGVTMSDQDTNDPAFPCVSSVIWSCQVPATRLPMKALNAWAGRNEPTKGA